MDGWSIVLRAKVEAEIAYARISRISSKDIRNRILNNVLANGVHMKDGKLSYGIPTETSNEH